MFSPFLSVDCKRKWLRLPSERIICQDERDRVLSLKLISREADYQGVFLFQEILLDQRESGVPPAEDKGHLMLRFPSYLVSSRKLSPLEWCLSRWGQKLLPYQEFSAEISACESFPPSFLRVAAAFASQPLPGRKLSGSLETSPSLAENVLKPWSALFILFFPESQQLSHFSCGLSHGFSDKTGTAPPSCLRLPDSHLSYT